MTNLTAYHAIKATCARVGWPTAYRTDLTKGIRQQLSRKTAPETFGFGLRDTGAELFLPDSMADYLWAEVQPDDGSRLFFWYDADGPMPALRPVSKTELLRHLALSFDLPRMRVELMQASNVYSGAAYTYRQRQTAEAANDQREAEKEYKRLKDHLQRAEALQGDARETRGLPDPTTPVTA